jgi:hypothetical protein
VEGQRYCQKQDHQAEGIGIHEHLSKNGVTRICLSISAQSIAQ